MVHPALVCSRLDFTQSLIASCLTTPRRCCLLYIPPQISMTRFLVFFFLFNEGRRQPHAEHADRIEGFDLGLPCRSITVSSTASCGSGWTVSREPKHGIPIFPCFITSSSNQLYTLKRRSQPDFSLNFIYISRPFFYILAYRPLLASSTRVGLGGDQVEQKRNRNESLREKKKNDLKAASAICERGHADFGAKFTGLEE